MEIGNCCSDDVYHPDNPINGGWDEYEDQAKRYGDLKDEELRKILSAADPDSVDYELLKKAVSTTCIYATVEWVSPETDPEGRRWRGHAAAMAVLAFEDENNDCTLLWLRRFWAMS